MENIRQNQLGETDRIRHIDGDWRILNGKGGMWPQKYDTAEDAHAALSAYHVNQCNKMIEDNDRVIMACSKILCSSGKPQKEDIKCVEEFVYGEDIEYDIGDEYGIDAIDQSSTIKQDFGRDLDRHYDRMLDDYLEEQSGAYDDTLSNDEDVAADLLHVLGLPRETMENREIVTMSGDDDWSAQDSRPYTWATNVKVKKDNIEYHILGRMHGSSDEDGYEVTQLWELSITNNDNTVAVKEVENNVEDIFTTIEKFISDNREGK